MNRKILLWALMMMICVAGSAAGNYSPANFTGSIMEQNYNLTPLMGMGTETSDNPSGIDSPVLWIAHWNQELGDWPMVTFLYVFAGLLFLIVRRRPEVKDSEAALYAGFVGTILGIFLFVIDVTEIDGYKIIKWTQLLPIVVITAFSIILNMANRNY